MLSLPIPSSKSPILYGDINSIAGNVGNIVEALTNGRINKNSGAHLDPDVEKNSLLRDKRWKPIFGQTDQAQGHLRNQGVDKGDLFLFYGWFKNVTEKGLNIKYKDAESDKHVIWGWLQVGEIDIIDDMSPKDKPWARYHPHFHQSPNKSNTLYSAISMLSIGNMKSKDIPGAGVFRMFNDSLLLTDNESKNRSIWKLPEWFYPSSEKTALSFHSDMSRWSKYDGYSKLKTVGRGQEFVLDTKYFPKAINWAMKILDLSKY